MEPALIERRWKLAPAPAMRTTSGKWQRTAGRDTINEPATATKKRRAPKKMPFSLSLL